MKFLTRLPLHRFAIGILLAGSGWINARAEIDWVRSSLAEVQFSPGQFYCYAPAVVRDTNAVHYWFCRNAEAGVVRDHIYYLKQRPAGGEPLQRMFGPASGRAWDSFHVCDPAILRGRFGFGKTNFAYALFYLGNNVDASADNQVGVAFANKPTGPWVRHLEPVVAYPPQGHWGAGQPAAINLDGQGRIALFYTKADPTTAGYFREINFRRNGRIALGKEYKLPSAGLLGTTGKADYLNNFDVAYDSKRDRYIAVREAHPYPKTDPNFISTTLEIVSIAAKDVRKEDARWQHEGSITPELTDHPRNHNAGIEKTWSGALPDSDRIGVVFTVSCAGPACSGTNSLWTYGLWQISGHMR